MRALIASILLFACCSAFGQALTLNDPNFVAPETTTPSGPAFGGVLYITNSFYSNGATTPLTVTNSAPSGSFVVVSITVTTNAYPTGVTDSRSNSYSLSCSNVLATDMAIANQWYSKLTTGLQSGDSVTIAWSTNLYTTKNIGASYVTGASLMDTNKSLMSNFSSSINVSANVSAPAAAIGFITTTATPVITPSNFIAFSSGTNSTTPMHLYYIAGGSGSVSLSATLSANQGWVAMWTAFR